MTRTLLSANAALIAAPHGVAVTVRADPARVDALLASIKLDASPLSCGKGPWAGWAQCELTAQFTGTGQTYFNRQTHTWTLTGSTPATPGGGHHGVSGDVDGHWRRDRATSHGDGQLRSVNATTGVRISRSPNGNPRLRRIR